MKNVLVINTVGFQYNGIYSVISNYLINMNREGIRFVFPLYKETMPSLKAELESLGEIAIISNRKRSITNYLRELVHLLKKSFDVVHIHGNSGTMLIEVVLAKLCGVKNIIIHAHSTRTNHPVINFLLKVPMVYLADECLACSKAAGDWLYGKHSYTVLNNAIELSRFRFNAESRKKYREEFGVREEFLVGHIGHFSEQKNHFFLIDVFYEFHKLKPNAKLLLISDGPRFEQVKAKVAELGLQDSVIFAGRRSDVAGIYSAMDLFLLPSLWEGLGMVLVEAQAAGLPCVVSDRVPYEAKMTDKIDFLCLEDGPRIWAEHILCAAMRDRAEDSVLAESMIREHGYDIKKEADKLRKLYLG